MTNSNNKEPLRLLLVDDDEDEFILLHGLVSEQFTQTDQPTYNLDWVDSYSAALSAYDQEAYDAFIVDYHLGQESGLDLVRELSSRGVSAPFILLTGQGSYEIDTEAMQAGATDYLSKDQLNAEQLERSIRYAIEHRHTQEDLEQRVQERTLELRDTEQRFHTLADSTSAAIFIVQDFVIRYTNPAALIITGYQEEELLGHSFLDLIHPDYRENLRKHGLGNPWAEGIPARYEVKIRKKGGQERWLDITAGHLSYEGHPAWILTAFDITDRDLAERELRKAKADLEARVAERTLELQQANQQLEINAAQAEMLAKFSQAFAEADTDYLSVLQMMAIRIASWTGDACLIRMVCEDGFRLKPEALFHPEPELYRSLRDVFSQPLRLEELSSIQNLAAGEPAILPGSSEKSLPPSIKNILQGRTAERLLHQWLIVPLLPGGRLLGTIEILRFNSTAAFPGGLIDFLRDIAEHASMAIENARLYLAEAERVREVDALQLATAALVTTIELKPLLGQILEAAQQAIPAAEKSMLYLVEPDTGILQMSAVLSKHLSEASGSVQIDEYPTRTGNFKKSKSYPALAWRKRTSFLIADAQKETSFKPLIGKAIPAGQARSLIAAPLIMEDAVLGTITLVSSLASAFSPADLRLLNSFAATTTAAINNAQLHAEVQRLAVSDPLTGKYNRRGFFELGQREIDRSYRSGRSVSVIILDVDLFKEINDTFGHSAGDQVLRTMTERASSVIRNIDLVGRLGGDEFAVLLPETDLPTAVEIAGRIRQAVVQTPFSVGEASQIILSISMGVTQAPPCCSKLEEVLTQADDALYTAKQNGRNRIEIVPPAE